MNAKDWMKSKGYSWNSSGSNPVIDRCGPENAKKSVGVACRKLKGEAEGGKRARRYVQNVPIKAFVEQQKDYDGVDCVFVPFATKGRPAKVKFCGKSITAARYICLLTHGAPKYAGALARHTCGNGHLSCVNPNHVKWGDRGDNQSDANNHKASGENIQDRIFSVAR